MPIHEYDCAACGERIEVWTRRLDETPAVRCARCGSERMTRRISAPAVLRGGPAGARPDDLVIAVDAADEATAAAALARAEELLVEASRPAPGTAARRQ